MKIESKIGKVEYPAEKVYTYLIDFNNFKHLIPSDKVTDFESTGDSCSFSVAGIGKAKMKIIEKVPNSLVKIQGSAMANMGFTLWIQLKEMAANDTRAKMTIKSDMNPMLATMAKGPMKKFADMLIDQFEKMKFD